MSMIIQIAAAVVAVMAALCWILSAQSETKAEEESAIGPGWDGNLVGKNAKGHPIHLIPTLEAQAKWNSRAAWFAAAAASLQGLEIIFPR